MGPQISLCTSWQIFVGQCIPALTQSRVLAELRMSCLPLAEMYYAGPNTPWAISYGETTGLALCQAGWWWLRTLALGLPKLGKERRLVA